MAGGRIDRNRYRSRFTHNKTAAMGLLPIEGASKTDIVDILILILFQALPKNSVSCGKDGGSIDLVRCAHPHYFTYLQQ